MELNNEFRVAVPAAKPGRCSPTSSGSRPAFPGARCCRVDGDEFTGAVKVKVGPITVSYKGEAAFQEKDAAAQRVVIRANGKETRGSGTAAARRHRPAEGRGSDATDRLVITTDLTISGKAAQFGRGVLADVSGNLIAQFAEALEADLLGGSAPTSNAPTAETRAAVGAPHDAADSVDLLKVVALPWPSGSRRCWPASPRVLRSGSCWDAASASARGACVADDLQAALAAAAVMKAAPFAYHRPDSVKEAVDLLDEYGDDAKVLAGGQSLVPMLAMRLTHFENLIDISRIDELQSIDLCATTRSGSVRARRTPSSAWTTRSPSRCRC